MRVVKQEVQEVMEVPSTYEDTLKHIERVGRICYQSEGKISETSAEKFCKMLFDRQHHAMIEHSWLVLKVYDIDKNEGVYLDEIFDSPFINIISVGYGVEYVCGNWRAFIDCLNKTDDWSFFSAMPDVVANMNIMRHLRCEIVHGDDIPLEARAFSAIMKTDRAVTHELVRHRPASYAQESQRYCAYRDEVEFIEPYMYKDKDVDDNVLLQYSYWEAGIAFIEQTYKYLMSTFKEKPQEARSVLPNCTATQIVVTADVDEWQHIFKMRTSPAAYPAIRSMMNEIEDIFVENGFAARKYYPEKEV